MRISRLAVVALVVLTGCTAARGEPAPLPASQTGALVESLPTVAGSTLPTMRLAEGLVPPTNRWFSGLVFSDEPQPVFPLPLSFELLDDGFRFGVPTVTSSAGIVSAPAAADLIVTTGAGAQTVIRYDEISVTIAVAGGQVTIARGSPQVSFTADSATTLGFSAAFSPRGADSYTATTGGGVYGLVAPGAALDGTALSVPEGGSATWFAVPHNADAADLFAYADTAITAVATSYSSDSSGAVTALHYSDAQTLVGALPHQRDGLDEPERCDLGTFATVYGEMGLCAGTTLRWSVPTLEPRAALDLTGLDPGEREELTAQLGRDIAASPDVPEDTYFGGKALARLANLLQLARGLDDQDAAASLTATLVAALRTWTRVDGCEQRSTRCFEYDPAARGIVGQTASFGSDAFNDHHFHYGYFLFAAAVAAQDDPATAAELAPVVTLLAADIASGTTSEDFPVRRVFDPYSGHSWASGYSPFRDGNNQESSSEAVAAWNALAAWAAAAGDDALASEAQWMLSAEANSATHYWLEFDTSIPPWNDYERSVVGIVWDGKRDYATWFSAEPSAILGIQLLPLAPVGVDYLSGDSERIRENVAEASPPGQFTDYLLMYSALAGPGDAAAALDAARALPESEIDDGNSRSYMLAWIMSRR